MIARRDILTTRAVGHSVKARVTGLDPHQRYWYRFETRDRHSPVGRFQTSLPFKLNELAILITARKWTAQYEWFAHHRLALKAGLDPALAEDIAQGRRPAKMAPDEETVYDFCHQLHTTHQVSDAAFNAMKDKFGEQGVVDLIAVSGYYEMVSMILNVDRAPLPGGGKPPLPILKQPLP